MRYTLLLLTASVLMTCQPDTAPSTADLVLHNTSIYTVDASAPKAEAVAVKADRIIFVGSNEGVQAYITPETKVLDLNGHTVYPGLIESHGHLLGLGRQASIVDLTRIESYQDLLDSVKAAT